MIEYRKLPKGNELIGKPGLGMDGIQNTTPDEIEAVIREAVANEINLFDLRAGGAKVLSAISVSRRTRRLLQTDLLTPDLST